MTNLDPILATLEEYADAHCAKDLERLMTLFVDGDAISLIGTGGDELCSGRSAVSSVFARNFRDATATPFEWGWKDIAVHGEAEPKFGLLHPASTDRCCNRQHFA